MAALVDLVEPLAFFVAGTGASESESEATEDDLRFRHGLGAGEPKPTLVGAILAYVLLAGGIIGRRYLRLIVKVHLPVPSMKIHCRQSISLTIPGFSNAVVDDKNVCLTIQFTKRPRPRL